MLFVGRAILGRVSSDECGITNKISAEQNENMARNSNKKCRVLLTKEIHKSVST